MEESEYYRELEENGVDIAVICIAKCVNHMILEELKDEGVI